MNGDGAGRLGEQLLGEVEVEDLNSVVKSVREMHLKQDESATHPYLLSIPGLLPHTSIPSVLEIVSPPLTLHPSSAGKTSLLHLLIAYAILPPRSPSSVPLYGHDAAIILFDPLHHFSVPRLAQVMLHHLRSLYRSSGRPLDVTTKLELKRLVRDALPHVHIFRPTSWNELLCTLQSLPTYLFNPTAHPSSQRTIHALILEDVDTFAPELRRPASTLSTSTTTPSTTLTTLLLPLSTLLSCTLILTSLSTSLSPSHTALRPVLPLSWPQGVVPVRIGVRRVSVLPFAPGMSAEEAVGEKGQRDEVVGRGRFEWWRVGGGGGDGMGGVFRVGSWGVEVEREEERSGDVRGG